MSDDGLRTLAEVGCGEQLKSLRLEGLHSEFVCDEACWWFLFVERPYVLLRAQLFLMGCRFREKRDGWRTTCSCLSRMRCSTDRPCITWSVLTFSIYQGVMVPQTHGFLPPCRLPVSSDEGVSRLFRSSAFCFSCLHSGLPWTLLPRHCFQFPTAVSTSSILLPCLNEWTDEAVLPPQTCSSSLLAFDSSLL